jgi:hypothetical protein
MASAVDSLEFAYNSQLVNSPFQQTSRLILIHAYPKLQSHPRPDTIRHRHTCSQTQTPPQSLIRQLFGLLYIQASQFGKSFGVTAIICSHARQGLVYLATWIHRFAVWKRRLNADVLKLCIKLSHTTTGSE